MPLPLSLIERLGAKGLGQAATSNALRGLPVAASAEAGYSGPKLLGGIAGVGTAGALLAKALRKKPPEEAPPPRVSSEETRMEKRLREVEEAGGN